MEQIRFSIGEYTTPGLTFAEDLAAYREGGAEGIGIDVGLKIRDPAGDLARFKDSGLQATFCFPATSTVMFGSLSRGSRDPATRIEEICDGVRSLAAFEPVCVACGPGPHTGRDPREARELAVAGIKKVAKVASDVGVAIALEPMYSSMADQWSFLTDIPSTMDFLGEIDEPNTGIIVDVWHLWDTEDLLKHVRENTRHIVGVHLDDRRDPTRSWCDRVLPGDGIGGVSEFLGALDSGGYDGWLEVEIFSDDGRFGDDFPDSLWKRDPVDLVRAARAKTLEAWENRARPSAG
jgi:sugar phosphate isomerase/epimerase